MKQPVQMQYPVPANIQAPELNYVFLPCIVLPVFLLRIPPEIYLAILLSAQAVPHLKEWHQSKWFHLFLSFFSIPLLFQLQYNAHDPK